MVTMPYASSSLDIQTLEEVRDSLVDASETDRFVNTWGHANLESNLIPQPSSADGADIWTGFNQLRSASVNSITLTQIILDILLYYPTDEYAGFDSVSLPIVLNSVFDKNQ